LVVAKEYIYSTDVLALIVAEDRAVFNVCPVFAVRVTRVVRVVSVAICMISPSTGLAGVVIVQVVGAVPTQYRTESVGSAV